MGHKGRESAIRMRLRTPAGSHKIPMAAMLTHLLALIVAQSDQQQPLGNGQRCISREI